MENRYDFLSLKDVRFDYSYIKYEGAKTNVIKTGAIHGADIPAHSGRHPCGRSARRCRGVKRESDRFFWRRTFNWNFKNHLSVETRSVMFPPPHSFCRIHRVIFCVIGQQANIEYSFSSKRRHSARCENHSWHNQSYRRSSIHCISPCRPFFRPVLQSR